MDAKVCDCCGGVITDLHRAKMKSFYIQGEPIKDETTGKMHWWEVRKETPIVEIDLCGKCFDKITGFVEIGL
jgi:hypothetical protein